LVGDIHQPLHVSDLFSKEFPAGNAAGTQQYVLDPIKKQPMPLHMLWDSNIYRSTELHDVEKNARDLVAKFPRSAFPDLNGLEGPDDFEKWARESHEVAVDWAYDIETIPDPDLDTDSDKLILKMAKYILEGISPVDEAPAVPDEYWEKLQEVAPRRMALAGYRIADIILSAADRLDAERTLSGKVLDAMQRHGPTN